jgi:alpha-galactosidase
MTEANEDNQKLFIDRYLEEGMKIDYWWMDAGWYPCAGEWVNT